VLSIPERTVASRLASAMGRMRAALGPAYDRESGFEDALVRPGPAHVAF